MEIANNCDSTSGTWKSHQGIYLNGLMFNPLGYTLEIDKMEVSLVSSNCGRPPGAGLIFAVAIFSIALLMKQAVVNLSPLELLAGLGLVAYVYIDQRKPGLD